MKLKFLAVFFLGAMMSLHADNFSIVVFAADATDVAGLPEQFAAAGFNATVDVVEGTPPTVADCPIGGAVIYEVNNVPSDPVAIGNVLDACRAAGDGVVISGYGFLSETLGGAAAVGADASFNQADIGSGVNLSGSIVPTVAGAGILSGINLSTVSYYSFGALSLTVAPGATLLATDGSGNDLIAESSSGFIGTDFFLGNVPENNVAFFGLVGTLAEASASFGSGGSAGVSEVPDPPTFLLTITIVLILGILFRPHRA